MKQVVIVTGMHRSGTMCMAGILRTLGFDLGRNAIIETKEGLFENTVVTTFNDIQLSTLGWIEPPEKLKESEKLKELDAANFLVSRVKIMLQSEYKEDLICIKDPRLCLLLDCYLEAFQQLEWPVVVIRMERLKKDVETSLRVLAARGVDHTRLFDFYHERLNWIIQKRRPKVHGVNYDDMLKDPVFVAKGIASILGLEIDVDAHANKLLKFVNSKRDLSST